MIDMPQFLLRGYSVIDGPATNFKINRIAKLLMSPLNFLYQRGDY